MTKTLRDEAEIVALDYGFSSLQETIRVILKKLTMRQLGISITETESISLSHAAKKRYTTLSHDFKKNKNTHNAADADDFLKQLRA